MSKKSDVLVEIQQRFVDCREIDDDTGVLESDATTVCKDIYYLVAKIDSLE